MLCRDCNLKAWDHHKIWQSIMIDFLSRYENFQGFAVAEHMYNMLTIAVSQRVQAYMYQKGLLACPRTTMLQWYFLDYDDTFAKLGTDTTKVGFWFQWLLTPRMLIYRSARAYRAALPFYALPWLFFLGKQLQSNNIYDFCYSASIMHVGHTCIL